MNQSTAMDGDGQLQGRRVHFIGVAGSGMRGLARIALSSGAACSGVDRSPSPGLEDLRAMGLDLLPPQHEPHLPPGVQTVVASAAVKPDHPAMLEAMSRGVEVLKYAQMLGRLMRRRKAIAVAGTHGKSTTTSLLTHILKSAGRDPSFILGAQCGQIGGGSGVGGSDLLVAEACEYDRSFLNYHPRAAVILNLEEDHLDCYAGLEALIDAFAAFAAQVHREGFLLVHHEMPHRLAVVADAACDVETIGFSTQADWQVTVTRSPESGSESGSASAGPLRAGLWRGGECVARWPSPMPGDHMAYNAAAAAVLAHRLGVSWDEIGAAIGEFRGLDRRMQRLGSRAGVTIVDDYGHHPTEVDTTLRGLRQHYRGGRLICVFQPHQHSRTRFLMKQFAGSFEHADIVIVPHIYFVRDSEEDRRSVTANDLVDQLRQRGVEAMHLYPFEAIVDQLRLIARAGDLLVTMGAGDVDRIARAFLAESMP